VQPEDQTTPDAIDESTEEETTDRLSAAARRERLGDVAASVGERGSLDGDTLVVQVGDPVTLHIELDRDGLYTATWWATAQSDHGHHRWREAAADLLDESEVIATSALGGGFLVEVLRQSRSPDDVIAWATDAVPVNRVAVLLQEFPERVAALPPEPTPDFLVPPEPVDR
jgi:hypothetical protein